VKEKAGGGGGKGKYEGRGKDEGGSVKEKEKCGIRLRRKWRTGRRRLTICMRRKRE
jgi:hypothetical protein